MMPPSRATQAKWREAHYAAANRIARDIRSHASKYNIPDDLVQKVSVQYTGDGFKLATPRDFDHFEYGSLAPLTPPTGALRSWRLRRGHVAHQYLAEELNRRKLLEF